MTERLRTLPIRCCYHKKYGGEKPPAKPEYLQGPGAPLGVAECMECWATFFKRHWRAEAPSMSQMAQLLSRLENRLCEIEGRIENMEESR